VGPEKSQQLQIPPSLNSKAFLQRVRLLFLLRQVFTVRQRFSWRQCFCIYFAAAIFLYLHLHFYLVCANNLIGADILELIG
jgi:hypothetical protein